MRKYNIIELKRVDLSVVERLWVNNELMRFYPAPELLTIRYLLTQMMRRYEEVQ